MVVTIEPGFYQIPSIVKNKQVREQYQNIVHWDRLDMFDDVRGIRIEDDILVTKTGSEMLSQQLPTKIKTLELLMLI